jgi:sugar phosphate isomerase/epimerase
MQRREFMSSFGVAALAVRNGISQTSAPADRKLARICVSSWSFHTLFEPPRAQKGGAAPGKPMGALDFPEMIADRYGVHNLEIVLPHFASGEPAYIAEFKNRLKKAQSRLVNVPVDYDELWEKPALSSTDAAEREHAISLYRKGIDLAAALGSPMARCDPGTVNLADPSITINSYKTLVAYGKSKGVVIIVENHGGISQHPEVLAKILEASGAGALPDIGNFPDEATRERGLRLMYPLAKGISHAKLGAGYDLAKCLRIATEAGYTGLFSIEAGGRGDAYAAVQQILDALRNAL